MRNNIFIILLVALGILISGCGKKQESITELQEPISIEALGDLSASTQANPEVTSKTELTTAAQSSSTALPVETALEQLPPSGPYKPTNHEIQTALKNAGYYTALIDGKIGPLSKKAIEEFQNANGLKVDGKVGLRTWALLSKYLNPQPITSPSKSAKKR